MNTNFNTFSDCSPTLGAPLTGASWVHCNYCPTGTFSLVGQNLYQYRPSCIRYTLAKFFLFKHTLNIQIFMSYQIIFINKFLSSFVTKVFTPVFNFLMHQGYGMFVLLRFCFRESLLYFGKRLLAFLEEPWLINLSAIRTLDVGHKPKVYTNYLACFWEMCRRFNLTRKVHIPFIGGSTFNSTGFNSTFERPVKNDFNPINFGEVELSVRMHPKSRLRVGDGVIPPLTFEPWKSGFLSSLASSPKSFEGKVYSKLSILKDLGLDSFEFGFLRFPLCQILLGIIKGYRFLLRIPSSLSKCKSLIIDPPSLLQNVIHLGYLKFGWVDSVFESLTHIGLYITYLPKRCMIYFKLNRIVRFHPTAKAVGFPAHRIVNE